MTYTGKRTRHIAMLAAGLILGLLVGIPTSPLVSAASSFIVESGEPKAQIVISEEPERMVRLAADELQEYVNKISGAQLPVGIAPDDAFPVTIYVGRSTYTDELGIDDEGLDYGAFHMVSGPDYLVLFGRDFDYEPIEPWPQGRRSDAHEKWRELTDSHWETPMHDERQFNQELEIWSYDEGGSLNAVYEFLRSLGVRWFMPGDLGEVVPEMASIPLPEVDETVHPDYPVRHWIHGAAFRGRPAEILLYDRRVGVGSLYETLGQTLLTHGLRRILGNDAMKEAHPEYYAIINGEPYFGGQGHACFSSEGFFDEVVRYARTVFDHYDAPMLQLSPADGFRHCECKRCASMSASELVFGFTDRVAREVKKTHPDRTILAAGYTLYRDPPEKIEQFSPNLATTINNIGRPRFNNPEYWEWYNDLVDGWVEKLAPNRLIRVENTRYGARPFPILHPRSIARDLQTLKGVSLGERNELRDRRDFPAATHLNTYVMGRYYWDADQDIEELLDEYYTLFYGPAAGKMKEAFDLAESQTGIHPGHIGMDNESGAEFMQLVVAAREEAGDTIYRERIDLLLREIVRDSANLTGDEFVEAVLAYAPQRIREQREAEEGRMEAPLVVGALPGEEPQTYELVQLQTGEPADERTTFTVEWDEGNLIFDIRCEDSDMENLFVSGNIFSGDSVAILLETPLHTYYQIEVNPDGLLWDADREFGVNDDWSSLADVETERGDDFWRVRVSIPVLPEEEGGDPLHYVMGDRPTMENPWFIQVGRARFRDFERAGSYGFTATGGNYHVRMRFGRLVTEEN